MDFNDIFYIVTCIIKPDWKRNDFVKGNAVPTETLGCWKLSFMQFWENGKWDSTNSGGDPPQPLNSKIGQKVHPVSPEENEAFTKL